MKRFLISSKSVVYFLIIIFFLSFFMHFRVFKLDIISFHSWRQTQTQSTINNFYEEDFNIFNPRENSRGNGDGIKRMEFPVMQWLIAGTYKILDNNSITITRVFTFLLGLLSTIGMYLIINLLFKNRYGGLIGAYAFLFSPLVYYYFMNPMPDNFALTCGIYGIYFFFKYYQSTRFLDILFSAFFLSLGALSKLPFIIYFSIPITYYILKLIKRQLQAADILPITIGLLFLALPTFWYIKVVPTWHGNSVAYGVFSGNFNGKELFDYFQHNLISTLPESLIGYASFPFFILSIYYIGKNKLYKKDVFIVFAVCGFFLVSYYIYEINLIAKVHDYYLMPYLPLLFILVAFGAAKLLAINRKYAIITILVLLLVPVATWLRMKGRWDENEPGFNRDLYTYRHELQKVGNKDDLCVVGNDESQAIWMYHLNKKGWSFYYNRLNSEILGGMINEGAKYLVTDSESVLKDSTLFVHLDSLVLQRGSISVFALKK